MRSNEDDSFCGAAKMFSIMNNRGQTKAQTHLQVMSCFVYLWDALGRLYMKVICNLFVKPRRNIYKYVGFPFQDECQNNHLKKSV